VKLVTRLWIFGAFVPSLGMIALAVTAGAILKSRLSGSLDRALLTQAAVESVSLFDGPDEPESGDVHLHMELSPLEKEVRAFAPSAAIYRADGSLVSRYPEESVPEPRVLPRDLKAPPELTTRRLPSGEELREVTNSLLGDEKKVYTLRISASLAPIGQTMSFYWRTSIIGVTLFVGLLFLLQGMQARRLTTRLAILGRHVTAVREGHLNEVLPEDHVGDEVSALRDLLAEATNRLNQARASQERLIADAAHELRTPLTIMRTGIDLALRRKRDAEELRITLEQTRDEVVRLASLASRLLDLAAQGQVSLERASGDLRPIILEAIDAALPAAEARNLSINWELPERATAFVHAPSVRQALDNLLSNAIKYAPNGSEIRVKLSERQDHWAISVFDPGPGIPREHRDTVFAPFHRVPGALPGSGLGLAIVKEVAHQHGGRAFVDEVAPGTSVVLEIPRREELAA
jgi:signal transduction histidine kinase